VSEEASPQNYQDNGDGGNKSLNDKDTEKKNQLMETMETVMTMMEVAKKSEQKMVKRKNLQDLLLPI
jgi:hypothetical protein